MRESIKIFADAMEKKLQRDDDCKPPWENLTLGYLFNRLLDEIAELAEAEGPENKMTECTDVANFAMMIFSKLHSDTQSLSRGRRVDNE